MKFIIGFTFKNHRILQLPGALPQSSRCEHRVTGATPQRSQRVPWKTPGEAKGALRAEDFVRVATGDGFLLIPLSQRGKNSGTKWSFITSHNWENQRHQECCKNCHVRWPEKKTWLHGLGAWLYGRWESWVLRSASWTVGAGAVYQPSANLLQTIHQLGKPIDFKDSSSKFMQSHGFQTMAKSHISRFQSHRWDLKGPVLDGIPFTVWISGLLRQKGLVLRAGDRSNWHRA